MKETFVEQILANLEDPDAYQVYSDWLTEQGDPRGEFIRIQMRLQNGDDSEDAKQLQTQEEKLLAKNYETWIEEFASLEPAYEYLSKPTIQFQWGFPARISISHLDTATAMAMADAKVSQFIREIDIYYLDSVYDLGEVGEGEQPSSLFYLFDSVNLPNFKRFALGNPDFKQEYYNCETQGFGVIELMQRFDQLEDVRVAARGANAPEMFRLELPNLQKLYLMHEHEYPVSVLADNSSLTNLEELAIYPHALEHGDEPYLDLDDLRAVCESPNLKKLKHLCFRLTNMGDEAARVILNSDLLDHLEVLDLANGSMTDEGAALLAASPKFSNLSRINLNRNALKESGIETLKATGVDVSANDQHTALEEDYWLFEGDIE